MLSPTSTAWLRCVAILLLLAAITAWATQHQSVLRLKMEAALPTAASYLDQGADELRDIIHAIGVRILETLS